MASEAYQNWVVKQVAQDYGLSGLHSVRMGLPASTPEVWIEAGRISGLPFDETILCALRRKPDSEFSCTLHVPVLDKLRQGENYLLTVWTRARSSAGGDIVHSVEYFEAPYTKLFWYGELIRSGWKQWWFPFSPHKDFAPEESRYQLLLRNVAQQVELGGLALFLYETEERSEIPDSRVYPKTPGSATDEESGEFISALLERRGRTARLISHGRETTTLESGYTPPFCRRELRSVDDQNFSLSLRSEFQADERPCFVFSFPGPFQGGDELELLLSLRSPTAEGKALASVTLEGDYREGPLLTRHLPLTGQWLHFNQRFPALGMIGEYGSQLQILIDGPVRDVEFGGIALLNHGARSVPPYEIRSFAPPSRPLDPRIDSIRRRDLTIQVVDAEDRPVPGVEVSILQTSHSFGLGTAVRMDMLGEESHDLSVYAEKLFNLSGRGAGFNRVCPEWRLSWAAWSDSPSSDRARVADLLGRFADHNLHVRGHYLVSGNFTHLPASVLLRRHDREFVLRAVTDRIQCALADPVLHSLTDWDLLNEPFMVPDLVNLLGIESLLSLFKLAAKSKPEATFWVNEGALLSVAGLTDSVLLSVRKLMERLRDETDAKIGLGLEGHFRGYLPSDEAIERVLTTLSDPGWALRVSEFDICGVPEDESARFTDDFLTRLMKTPGLTELDLWGFWDHASWCKEALLFRSDWSLKASGAVYLQRFFDDWWTEISGQTDEKGEVQARVFQGKYLVNVKTEQESTERFMTVEEERARVVIALSP